MTKTLPQGTPERLGLSTAGLQRIDQKLQSLIDSGEFPGAVVLVARHGNIAHCSALGLKNIAKGEALSLDTIFAIFSMTKPVTAAAMMILFDRGLWSPSDPIAKHLPEFENVRGPDMSQPDHPPTMLELMTHTAGFGYGLPLGPADPTDAAYIEAGVWDADNLADMSRRVASIPLAYQPGSRWRYSLSMDLQGALIERLSGKSLPDFMRSEIFEPLGMVDTDFYVPAAKRSRLATLYHKYGMPDLTELDHPAFKRDGVSIAKIPSGGGGLYSTAMDYARFAQMLLGKGELDGSRIIQASSVEMMTANHLSGKILNGGFVAGVHKIRPGYGYGFNGAVIFDPVLAGEKAGKGTYQWDGASGVWFWIDPVNQLLFIGMIQRMLQEGMPLLQSMTQAMIDEALI